MKIKFFLKCCLALISFHAFAAIAQNYPMIKGYVADAKMLSKESANKIKLISEVRINKSVAVVSIENSAFSANGISFATSGAKNIKMTKIREERRSSTDKTWIGRTEQGGDAFFTIVDNKISGIIRDANSTYELKNLDDKFHVLVEVDRSLLPPEHPSIAPSGELRKKSIFLNSKVESVTKKNDAINSISSTAITPKIDVLIAYTPQAAIYLGNFSGAFQLAISQMNQSFANSSVALQANLVGTVAIGKDFSTSDLALQGLINSPGPTIARDALKADVVILVGHFGDSCGLANAILATPSTSYAVVSDSCLNSNLSMAHEIGHLLGARHDVAHDPTNVPFAYGHGFYIYANVPNTGINNPNRYYCFHTIMSYASGCPDPDPRINYWSNSGQRISMYGTSWPLGNSQSSNATVLNSTGGQVAQFGETRIAGGFISALASAVTNIIFMD